MMQLLKKFYSRILIKAFSPVIRQISQDRVYQTKMDYIILIERACRAGYEYHQRMIKKNPELLNWVLKDNYLDED